MSTRVVMWRRVVRRDVDVKDRNTGEWGRLFVALIGVHLSRRLVGPEGAGGRRRLDLGVGSAREARIFCQQRMGGGEVR